MHSSGITRRIDELGRIVIPKEIRYNLGIRNGEPLEIYVNEDNIIIKKYREVEKIENVGKEICEIISDICNVDVIISDREKIVASSKRINNIINTKIIEKHKLLIDNRESYISTINENLYNINAYFTILPIITSLDCSGLIFIAAKNSNSDNLKYAKIIQKIIIQKLDIA